MQVNNAVYYLKKFSLLHLSNHYQIYKFDDVFTQIKVKTYQSNKYCYLLAFILGFGL